MCTRTADNSTRLTDFLSWILDHWLSRPLQSLISRYVGALVQHTCDWEHGFEVSKIYSAQDGTLYVVGTPFGASQSMLYVLDSRGQIARQHPWPELVLDMGMDAQGRLHLLEWHGQYVCLHTVHALPDGFQTVRRQVVNGLPVRISVDDSAHPPDGRAPGCLYLCFPRRFDQPASIVCRGESGTLVEGWQWPKDQMAEIDDLCVTRHGKGTVLASGCLSLEQSDCFVGVFDGAAQFQHCWNTGFQRVFVQTERYHATRTSLLSRIVCQDNAIVLACGPHIGVFSVSGATLFRFEHHAFISALAVDAHHRIWVVCKDGATQRRSKVEGLLIE